MGLDYVDIFYSHRPDPDTPLEETMGALDAAVRAGQGALRRHLQLLGRSARARPAALLRELGTPLLIHQPSYSMFNRWIEADLLDAARASDGAGCIAFSPLAQGLLTDRYLDGVPADSRRRPDDSCSPRDAHATELTRTGPRASTSSPTRRGQTLAQMALAWVLRDPRMTSALIGASSVAQLDDNVAALGNLEFSAEELAEIEPHAQDSGVNHWAA